MPDSIDDLPMDPDVHPINPEDLPPDHRPAPDYYQEMIGADSIYRIDSKPEPYYLMFPEEKCVGIIGPSSTLSFTLED